MNDVSPGKLTTIISGAVVFLFGFFPWFGSGSYTVNAWSSDARMFPIATWAPIFGLIGALLIGLPAFAGVKLPEKILDYTMNQLAQISSLIALLVTLGFVIAGSDLGFGLYLSVLGAIGMIVGFVLDAQGVGANPTSGQGYVAPGGYAPQPGQPAPGQPAPGQPAPGGYAPQPGQPAPGQPAPGQQPPQQPGGSF